MTRCRTEGLSRERERERVKRLGHIYHDIIAFGNLLISWQEFLKGKRNRRDVTLFSLHFTDNILKLRQELVTKSYRHGGYQEFNINDPKPRIIHKAKVKDRLVHHALHRILYPYFDRKFIFDSYSCRLGKGTHRAIDRFRHFTRKVSKNNTRICWVLKADVKQFFASIDHGILKDILSQYISDQDALWLVEQVIDSFRAKKKASGLPLGNLTSQLLANIYLNELDQMMKRELMVKYYIRYADDFVVVHCDKKYLTSLIPIISLFLKQRLKLSLHMRKVSISTLHSGVDFLGWVCFPHHRILRTKTRKRVLRNLQRKTSPSTLASYLGLLSHGDTFKIAARIRQLRG